MNPMEARIQTLEAQINAMARAWLYLAATVEMQTGADMESMEESLLATRWPHNPDIDQEARDALRWLCDELAGARTVRQARTHACQ